MPPFYFFSFSFYNTHQQIELGNAIPASLLHQLKQTLQIRQRLKALRESPTSGIDWVDTSDNESNLSGNEDAIDVLSFFPRSNVPVHSIARAILNKPLNAKKCQPTIDSLSLTVKSAPQLTSSLALSASLASLKLHHTQPLSVDTKSFLHSSLRQEYSQSLSPPPRHAGTIGPPMFSFPLFHKTKIPNPIERSERIKWIRQAMSGHTRIDLSNCQLGTCVDDIRVLTHSLNFASCIGSSLYLYNNPNFGDKGALSLAEALLNKEKEKVNRGNSILHEEYAITLEEVSTHVGGSESIHDHDVLKAQNSNHTSRLESRPNVITELYLGSSQWGGCGIGPAGAVAIAQAITPEPGRPFVTITKMNLSHNPIGDQGATAIGYALQYNSTLIELILSHCGIEKAGGKALLAGVKLNMRLTKLILFGNPGIPQDTISLIERILHMPQQQRWKRIQNQP